MLNILQSKNVQKFLDSVHIKRLVSTCVVFSKLMFLLGWRFVKGLFLIALGFLIRDRDFPQVCTVHRITIFKHGRAKKIFNVQILKYFPRQFLWQQILPANLPFSTWFLFSKMTEQQPPTLWIQKSIDKMFSTNRLQWQLEMLFSKNFVTSLPLWIFFIFKYISYIFVKIFIFIQRF